MTPFVSHANRPVFLACLTAAAAPLGVSPQETASPSTRPEPVEFDRLTRHAAPRPRANGAVNEDWPGFLGPRRDGTSNHSSLR